MNILHKLSCSDPPPPHCSSMWLTVACYLITCCVLQSCSNKASLMHAATTAAHSPMGRGNVSKEENNGDPEAEGSGRPQE